MDQNKKNTTTTTKNDRVKFSYENWDLDSTSLTNKILTNKYDFAINLKQALDYLDRFKYIVFPNILKLDKSLAIVVNTSDL
jgi:hypothetical protein